MDVRRTLTHLTSIIAICVAACAASATDVKELARIEGQGESILQGFGLVIGLDGTGDSGDELATMRPLVQVLENMGNPIGDLSELESTRSVAAVLITCTIPPSGARVNDSFDVVVSAIGSSESLAGGQLFLAPLIGPTRDSEVYAMAEGRIEIEALGPTTVGRVRGGANIVRDINTSQVGEAFRLVLKPHYAGWSSSSYIADTINQEYFLQPGNEQPIARAIDDRMVSITIPEPERANKAGFIGSIMRTHVNPSFLGLPAQVVVNPRTGAIIVTADVEISPVAITHNNLTITTTTPPPVATAQNPLVERRRWAGIAVESSPRPRDSARLQDLLTAFSQLAVPPEDQIGLLAMLHKAGKLHARFIIDE